MKVIVQSPFLLYVFVCVCLSLCTGHITYLKHP